MTTPNQTAPDGAYQIGSGFGQTQTEEAAKELFRVPVPTPENMFEVLADVLLGLPLEALKLFQTIIGGDDETYESFDSAVDHIIDSLAPQTSFATSLGDVVQTILDTLTGLAEATPNDLDDWLVGILTGETVPISALSTRSPNLFKDPRFKTDRHLDNSSGTWSFDDTVQHGTIGRGLQCDADGTSQWVEFNKIATEEGQRIDFQIRIHWDSLDSSGGDTMRLWVVEYNDNGDVIGEVELDDSSADGNTIFWGDLREVYKVEHPDTEFVAMKVEVTENATDGVVWFSNAEAKKVVGLGLIPAVLIEGLEDTFDAIGEFFQWIIMTILEALTGIPLVGWLFDDLKEAFDDLFDTANGAAGKADDNEISIDEIIEDGLNGVAGFLTGRPLSEIFATQAQTIADQAAQLAEIQAGLDAGVNGSVTAIDRFEYSDADSLDPALWDSIYLVGSSANGFTKADGHNAVGVHGGTRGDWEQLHRYQGPDAESLTNSQRTTVILGQQLKAAGFLDPRHVFLDIYGRVSNDETKWVRARIKNPDFLSSNAEVKFQYVNGGAVQDLGDWEPFTNPSMGSALTLECGTAGGENFYRFLVNGGQQHVEEDSGSAIDVSSSTRYRGFGIGYDENVASIGDQWLPVVVQWTSVDNAAAQTIGSYAKVSRTDTAQTGTVGNGAPMGAEVCDVVDRISQDITYQSSNNRLTVSVSGVYQFKVSMRIWTDPPWAQTLNLGCFVNGVVEQWGQEHIWSNGNQEQFTESFTVYLDAGDYIEPAIDCSISDVRMKGEDSGSSTYMTLALVNRSFA